MQKSILLVISLLLLNFFLVADEVKSFATQKEQEEYVEELVDELPTDPKLMTEQEARKKIKKKEDLIAWLTAMGQRGKFIIIGKIVDENDNLLQDVHVEFAKYKSGLWESRRTSKEYDLSNYFVIYLNECDSVNMYLNKKGYISMVSSYYYGFNPKLFNAAQKDSISIKGNLILGNNLTFVMKKKGEIVKLQEFKGQLEYNETAQDYEVFFINSWKKSLKQDKTQRPYLQVKAETTNGYSAVTDLELISSNPADGFIAVKFDKTVRTHKNFWNLMGEAPDKTYSTQSLKILQGLGTPTFFYYFINGKYGKGWIERNGRFTLYQNNEKDSEKNRSLWIK